MDRPEVNARFIMCGTGLVVITKSWHAKVTWMDFDRRVASFAGTKIFVEIMLLLIAATDNTWSVGCLQSRYVEEEECN